MIVGRHPPPPLTPFFGPYWVFGSFLSVLPLHLWKKMASFPSDAPPREISHLFCCVWMRFPLSVRLFFRPHGSSFFPSGLQYQRDTFSLGRWPFFATPYRLAPHSTLRLFRNRLFFPSPFFTYEPKSARRFFHLPTNQFHVSLRTFPPLPIGRAGRPPFCRVSPSLLPFFFLVPHNSFLIS